MYIHIIYIYIYIYIYILHYIYIYKIYIGSVFMIKVKIIGNVYIFILDPTY